MYSKGLRTPWGTPLLTSLTLLPVFYAVTRLSYVQNLIKLIIFIEHPMLANLPKRISLITLSNAPSTSKNVVSVSMWLAKPSLMCNNKLTKLSWHDCPLRNPAWLLGSKLWCSHYDCNRLFTKLSKSLHTQEVRDTGLYDFPSGFLMKWMKASFQSGRKLSVSYFSLKISNSISLYLRVKFARTR